MVLEKTHESPLDSKGIKPVNPKGNQPWIFIGRNDAKDEALILWPPDAESWLIGKDPDTDKDWGQKKGTTKDEMVGWHHWLNGHEFEKAQGDSEGPGNLACFSLWSSKNQAWLTEQQQNFDAELRQRPKCHPFSLSPPSDFPSLHPAPLSLPHSLPFLSSYLFPLLAIPLCFLYKKPGWITLWHICQQFLGVPQLHALSQEFFLNVKEVSLFTDYTYGCSEPEKWLFPSQGMS